MEASDGTLTAAAISALQSDAGCEEERAKKLAEAIGRAGADEALEIAAGTAQVFGGAVDRRVAALDRIIRALDDGARLPSDFEVGVIFRVTPAQGRNVLRTYQARFSESYRERLQGRLSGIEVKKKLLDNTKVFVVDFDDPAVLEYAVDKLRRRGLSRSVAVDRTKLEIVVSRDQTDRLGKNAEEALKA